MTNSQTSSSRAVAANALGAVLGLGISAVFIWITFRGIDLAELWRKLPGLAAGPVLLCGLSQIVIQLLRLVRWGFLLRRLGTVTWRRVFAMGSVGLAVLYLLPARIGELARPLLASDETDIDFGRASSTVLTERFSDASLMAGVILVTLYLLGTRALSQTLVTSTYIFMSLVPLTAMAVILIYRKREFFSSLIQKVVGLISAPLADRLVRMFDGFLEGMRQATDRKVAGPYTALTAAIWMLELLSIYWLFGAIGRDLPFLAALTVLSALVVAATIPSGPGQVGVFEFGVLFGLGAFSVEPTLSVFYGTLLHVIATIPILAIGLLGIWFGNVKSGRLLRRLASAVQT